MENEIRKLRLGLGLSQLDLAKLAGTSQPQIDRLEKGLRKLTPQWAERLAPHLHVVSSDLLEKHEASLQHEKEDKHRTLASMSDEEKKVIAEWRKSIIQFSELDKMIDSAENFDDQFKLAATKYRLDVIQCRAMGINDRFLPLGENEEITPENYIPLYSLKFDGENQKKNNWFPERFYDIRKRPPFLYNQKDAYVLRTNSYEMEPRFDGEDELFINPNIPIRIDKDFLIFLKDGSAICRNIVSIDETFVICQQYRPPEKAAIRRDEILKVHCIVAALWDNRIE